MALCGSSPSEYCLCIADMAGQLGLQRVQDRGRPLGVCTQGCLARIAGAEAGAAGDGPEGTQIMTLISAPNPNRGSRSSLLIWQKP